MSHEDRSEISFIIMEAKEHAQFLDSWRVSQVKGECNSITHDLAHLARRSVDSAVWLCCALACVADQIASDCNSIHA
jgi:hypothetical protein